MKQRKKYINILHHEMVKLREVPEIIYHFLVIEKEKMKFT